MDKDLASTVSGLLRQLLDVLDGVGNVDNRKADYETETPEQSYGSADSEQPDDLFVPPLQLKMELLKKAVGVENIYDDNEEEQEECHSYDELDIIKKNAGIISELSDDEPLEQ